LRWDEPKQSDSKMKYEKDMVLRITPSSELWMGLGESLKKLSAEAGGYTPPVRPFDRNIRIPRPPNILKSRTYSTTPLSAWHQSTIAGVVLAPFSATIARKKQPTPAR
jgi:hypothetical protein